MVDRETNRKTAVFLRNVAKQLEADTDITRALRMMHMKEVNLRKKGLFRQVGLIRQARRLI